MSPIEIILVVIGAFLVLVIGYYAGKKIGAMSANRTWEKKIPSIREDATKRSRAVLTGQFTEQLAPFLPDFPFNPSEARFIGKPIDFLVFKGMENKEITEVVFVEVKTGQSRLNNVEKSLKTAIEEGKVSWAEYRHKP